ncbi:MAG: ABC transporter permease subunit [Tannerellaceae bacterium]|jgi:ABC-type transport system involved in multi-copper enzyme maturation permease subunit|nr:ABC transporter permease subunit [Tannerellaceae bacterium]
MIRLIAKKDFLLNLLSVRFIIGFVLCLVIIPFTVTVSVDDYLARVRIYEIEQKKADDGMKKARVWSAVRPVIVTRPEPLSIFSAGITNNAGNSVKIAFDACPLFPSGHISTRDNPLLNAFFSIDFSKVIAILISLIALVFAYDSITREREDGTMKLSLTGQVSRISFLSGKLAGLLLTLLPILLFCYLLACLIIVVNPGIALSAADWGGIALLFFSSAIYMLVFILLGMFISGIVKSSSSSIIVSLLCWIWFLFLTPNISTYLSQSIVKTPLYDNVQSVMHDYDKAFEEDYFAVWRRIRNEMGIKNLNFYNNRDGEDGLREITGGTRTAPLFLLRLYPEIIPLTLSNADKKWALQRNYLGELEKQQRLQQRIALLSPSELFRQITEAICSTGAGNFLKYMEQIRYYREGVIRYFTDNKLFASSLYFTPQPLEEYPAEEEIASLANEEERQARIAKNSWMYPCLDTSNVPVYRQQQPFSLPGALDGAFTRLAALFGLVVLLLAAMIASFMKYDVR